MGDVRCGGEPSGAPADATSRFLDALQVPANQIPSSTEAQQSLYRSLLADRRMLIVLDNARDVGQVRPLLPGGPRCLVLVTSRNQLTGLVAAEGAHPVTLDLLSPADARELLARRIGPERIAAELDVATELTGLCARLPLAVSIAAARVAMHPHLPLATLVSELRDAAGRLDVLDAGEAASSVRAVFSWSYQNLSQPAARMFRLLGVHPGPDITVAAAASLAGVSPGQARQGLSQLIRSSLIAEHLPGRFAFHDLLRAYAAERAGAEDGEAQRRAATRRMLDHYLHTAYAAALALNPHLDQITLAPPEPTLRPEPMMGYERALAWFEAEHRVLLAVLGRAVSAGFDTHAWQLPLTMATLTTQQIAMAAACHARRHYGQALDLYRQLGDQAGEGRAQICLGLISMEQGQYRESLSHTERALAVYRCVGFQPGQARALNNIGWCYAQLGDYHQALAHGQKAIALAQEIGDQHGQAVTWDSLGYAHHHLGQYPQAIACYQRALAILHEEGDRFRQTNILSHISDTNPAHGEQQAAIQAWQQALAILDDLGHPVAEEVRARLRGAQPAKVAQIG